MAAKPLSTSQNNALTTVDGILAQYGLQSLSSVVLGYVKQGYNPDAINVLIQGTPEWKQRFAGNTIRAQNGLAPLDPATYLSTEAGYADALKAAGLPAGFYDGGSDYANWIGGDVSVTEVQQRANDAAQIADTFDSGAQAAFSQYTGIDKGGVTAYLLDQGKALPILQQQMAAAQIGGAAIDQGYGLSAADATKYADLGVTASQAQQAYQQIGATLPGEQKLASIYNQSYNQQDLENELLGGNGAEQQKRLGLNEEEEANFGGSGAVGSTLAQPGFGVAKQTEGSF